MVDDITIQYIQAGLDFQKTRQYIAAYNVANSSIKSRAHVDFGDYLNNLQEAEYSGNTDIMMKAVSSSKPEIEYAQDVVTNIDMELALSNDAVGKYSALTELLRGNIKLMTLGIRGNI